MAWWLLPLLGSLAGLLIGMALVLWFDRVEVPRQNKRYREAMERAKKGK